MTVRALSLCLKHICLTEDAALNDVVFVFRCCLSW